MKPGVTSLLPPVAVVILLAISASLSSGADDFFLPNERVQYTPEVPHPAWSTNLQEACRALAEFQPAERDAAGNWGPVTNGLQLSVRVSKLKAIEDAPLTLAIILRNCDTNAGFVVGITGWDWAVGRDRNALPDLNPVDKLLKQRMTSGPQSYRLEPRQQIKWLYYMDSLPPGTNFVVAAAVAFLDRTNAAIIRSGIAEVYVPQGLSSPIPQSKPSK
jgi:hypothetical protein